MEKLMHLMREIEINFDRDLMEFPACESGKDYNSGRWTDKIDDVNCSECLAIWDAENQWLPADC